MPCLRYFHEYIWPGLGLFGESYLLFSIGTIRPLWDVLYPQCFSGNVCSANLVNSLTYSVVVGIILGMVVIGTMAGSIGRRKGSITTAALMMIGSCGMTFGALIFRNDPEKMLKNLVTFLFVFGMGIGGEYPLSASSASERAMSEMKRKLEEVQMRKQQLRVERNPNVVVSTEEEERTNTLFDPTLEARGKRVILIFSMQGMGIFVNTLILTLLLLVTGQWGKNIEANYYDQGDDDGDDGNDVVYYRMDMIAGDYNHTTLLIIWQIIYIIGTITLIYVFISRYRYLQESEVWAEDRKKRRNNDCAVEYQPPRITSNEIENTEAYNSSEHRQNNKREMSPVTSDTQLLLKHYGHRLFGTSVTWFLWDVAFYGNKLFQSTFLYALTGVETTLFQISGAATLNALIAVMGYIAAAMLVDKPEIGRLKLQQYGFLITGCLFCLCGAFRQSLSTPWLIIMYFGSSFFGQCGPNCTTFLLPAEIFPTEMRTVCHGVSASAGKCGALLAAVMFNYLSESDMFLISGYCSFAAFIITYFTIPESSTLDLHELDRKWRMTVHGKLEDYHGAANELRHLSVLERWSMRSP